MTDRRFRFGVVVAAADGDGWVATVRRASDLGYGTLLTPDATHLLSPIPSLALAAGMVPIRVGTFVLAAPLRPPRSAAWEAHTMTVLTGGRFEFGIGTGLPVAAAAARDLGLPGGTTSQRREQMVRTVAELRALDGDRHTPVMIAAAGPRAVELAAEHADIVALALSPTAPRDDADRMVARLREHAGDRADRLEFSHNVFVVGDRIPADLARFVGSDLDALVAAESLTLLQGTPGEMADELQRRRDRFGISYVTVNGAFLEEFAPVVELLADR